MLRVLYFKFYIYIYIYIIYIIKLAERLTTLDPVTNNVIRTSRWRARWALEGYTTTIYMYIYKRDRQAVFNIYYHLQYKLGINLN